MTDIAERFKAETADHHLAVLRDDGLYRHLRFAAPNTGFYWFDLVTWPGRLAFTGDIDGYMFARTDDMFAFFRGGADYGVNPTYWSEKVVDGRNRLRVYDEYVLRQRVKQAVTHYEQRYPSLCVQYRTDKPVFDRTPYADRYPMAARGLREPVEPMPPAEVRELVADYESDGWTMHESGARDLLRDLEKAGVVSDTWEWDLTTWEWSFLWACHAIVWGIGQYDAARKAATS